MTDPENSHTSLLQPSGNAEMVGRVGGFDQLSVRISVYKLVSVWSRALICANSVALCGCKVLKILYGNWENY